MGARSMEMTMSESRAPAHPTQSAHSATRRNVVEGATATLATTAMAGTQGACATQAAAGADSPLYERLGGIFSIAAVVDHFSDAVVRNPVVGQASQNPTLREWHTRNLGRLPGLKFMRTLWVANVSGGPYQYTPTRPGSTNVGLEEAHRTLRISPAEFDEVAAELGRTLDHFDVPPREKGEVLAAFAAHKNEVTEGYRAANG
jgi:hemoglobin